jgi:GNAT superfamily N-acetyltransferase
MTAIPGTTVRRLALVDAEEALTLSTTAGWNQRPDDWRMLLRIAPEGSFAAIADGHIVGTAIGIDYGGFGWIAMMLVDPAFRGRGLGARLLEAAIEALPSSKPVRLDATPLGRPLYQRYGFEDETLLTRHVREPAPRRQQADRDGSTTHALRALDAPGLAACASLDRHVFGGDRRAVLEWMQELGPRFGFIAGDPEVAGYALGRNGRLFDQIGPVAAGDDETAKALVRASALAAEGRATIVDAFEDRTAFCAWLHETGFEPQRPLYRMCRPASNGARFDGDRKSEGIREYAILGPEFA